MGLPKVLHPTFSLVLPSTKQTIHFRPFLVKEEKILLIAQASEDKSDIVKAIKQVVQNCIVEDNIDVNDFTTFDLEYFFIKLRSKSVQKIGIATCIIRRHTVPLNKDFFQIQSIPTKTASWTDFYSRCG